MIIEISFYTGIIDGNNNLVVEYNYDGYGNIISILVNENVNEEEVTVSGVINSIVTVALFEVGNVAIQQKIMHNAESVMASNVKPSNLIKASNFSYALM